MLRARLLTALFAVLGALLLMFLALPIVAMAARESTATVWAAAGQS